MNLSIFDTYLDIVHNSDSQLAKKLKLNRLFQVVLDESLKDEKIHFTSLFSKLAYLGVRYELQGRFLFELHYLRKRLENPSEDLIDDDIKILSFIIPHLNTEITKENIPQAVIKTMPTSSGIPNRNIEVKKYIPNTRFLCSKIDFQNKRLIGFIDEMAEEESIVEFDIPDRNERFSNNIQNLDSVRLPILMELIEVEINSLGELRPAGIVIEPDFLVDVTAIASCFDHNGTRTVAYIYNKFLPRTWSKALLLGNVANYFLDRLVSKPTLTFKEIIYDVFQLDPLSFARIKDDEMNSLLGDMQKHFNHIQYTITKEFPKQQIKLNNSYLEPSFMSPVYGIQGRLDLLHMDEDYTSIIELKSGSIYKPNVYGLKNDHYTQTLLYDLLIRSTFKNKKPRNYILYSKEASRPLRIAPRIAAQQKEAMKVRNDLLLIEEKLADLTNVEPILNSINTALHSELKGFQATNVQQFEKQYSNLDRIEKDYFNSFVSFIALEHRLAKIGEYGQDKSNGLAGLWLDSHEEKMEQFSMVNHLKIESNQSDQEDPIITLYNSEKTNKLSNFRSGDIIILYPLNQGAQSALQNQVFKCSLIECLDDRFIVRLRSQQQNQSIFQDNEYWVIEHDMMDSSFLAMYKQIFEWASAPKTKRDLLLTNRAPSQPTNLPIKTYDSLTNEQNSLLHNMVNTQEYYLVWGPPGTGKTSRIISHYIKYIIDNTDENLYIMAYTNRAVDELCEAIHSLGEEYENQYIRIGSRYGTHPKYNDKLLQSKIKEVKKRQHLRETISNHRLVVGTLASMNSKEIIFELIKPKRLIVDEASQILEPNLVGMLSKFEQFILVGDHRQLPAVVVQDKKYSIIENPALEKLGLVDRRDSLFERLYRQCLKNKWTHALGQLQYQGRMHEDIMKFPNEEFYNNTLKVLPKLSRLIHQIQRTETSSLLKNHRLVFHHVDVPVDERFSKTNSAEVAVVVKSVAEFQSQGYPLEEIGVITPFRAQIAAIKDALLLKNPDYQSVSVDTVERFQGSARQVIIISFCVNSPIQFRTMVSISTEGIDRKLNVALTRAKEKLLIIGDQNVLRRNPMYDQLLDGCMKVEL